MSWSVLEFVGVCWSMTECVDVGFSVLMEFDGVCRNKGSTVAVHCHITSQSEGVRL